MSCGRVQTSTCDIVSGMLVNVPIEIQYKDLQILLRPFGVLKITILKKECGVSKGIVLFKCQSDDYFKKLENKLHGAFLDGNTKPLLVKKKMLQNVIVQNDSFFPKKEIGVYFGSFDPIHENHIALAKFAIEHCNIQEVVLAPNVDHISKPNMRPLSQRRHLIFTRLKETLNDKTLKHVHLFDTTNKIMNWQGRMDILQCIRNEWVKKHYFADVSIAQLIGQDSFLEPGCQRAIQSAHLNMRMIVFPRMDCKFTFAKEYKTKSVKVEIVENYTDKICFSSTKAREDLKNGIYPEGLHLTVYREILELDMYSRTG